MSLFADLVAAHPRSRFAVLQALRGRATLDQVTAQPPPPPNRFWYDFPVPPRAADYRLDVDRCSFRWQGDRCWRPALVLLTKSHVSHSTPTGRSNWFADIWDSTGP